MGLFLRLISGVLLLLFAFGCSNTKEDSKAFDQRSGKPDDAHVEGDVYTNAFFGFSITVPDGWSIMELEKLRSIQRERRNQMLNSKNPRMRIVAEDQPSTQLLMISRAPIGSPTPNNVLCNATATMVGGPISSREVVTHGINDLTEAKIGFTQRGEITGRDLGGVLFSEITLTLSMPKGDLVQKQVITVVKEHALAFILTAPNDQEMLSLESVLASIRFN